MTPLFLPATWGLEFNMRSREQRDMTDFYKKYTKRVVTADVVDGDKKKIVIRAADKDYLLTEQADKHFVIALLLRVDKFLIVQALAREDSDEARHVAAVVYHAMLSLS